MIIFAFISFFFFISYQYHNPQRDFPSAMDAVNSSSAALNEAVLELRTDPYSSQGRRKLITGAKGILTGQSQ